MLRNLPILVAIAIVLTAGLLHGNWTNRWGDAPELRYSVSHVPQLPKRIGEWQGEDIPLTEDQARINIVAELRVSVVRVYTNRTSGDKISIMAVCGTPGPIGTHTPEACYNGAGYFMAGNPQPVKFAAASEGGKPSTFWVCDFRRSGAAAQGGLKIYWSFRAGVPGSTWQAAVQPRADFAAYRALYKLYVIREMAMTGASPVDDDVTPAFIRELLPAFEDAVFAPMDREAPPKTALHGPSGSPISREVAWIKHRRNDLIECGVFRARHVDKAGAIRPS